MFICPSCGGNAEGESDLLICDECFEEAKEIRRIRSELSVMGIPVKLAPWLDEGQWFIEGESK